MHRENYPYLYETHLHTSMVSACAHNSPEEMVCAAKKKSYAGIFITEHNWRGNSCIDRSIPWEAWIDAMVQSYETARAVGEKVGLQVFFAFEAGFFGLPHHGAEFLIYGLTPQWLKEHPELKNMDAPQLLALVRGAGAMAIHAHPFREASYIERIILLPDQVDGVEVINANHSNPARLSKHTPAYDEAAVRYARQHHLPMAAGSDMHSDQLLGGGVAFARPLEDEQDYCRAIRGREAYVLTNGWEVFDNQGNLLPGHADWEQDP